MSTTTQTAFITSVADRDIRQRELVPPQKLSECHALVIGVGAIGRQVAIQLAAIGIHRLTLVDHDQVGVENLAPQGYWPEDLGEQKVKVTAALCERMHPHCILQTQPRRFSRTMARTLDALHCPLTQPVVFCCVDSIETRRLIWEATHQFAAFFVNGRMNAEVIRVLAVNRPAEDDHYSTTLFAAGQAYAGSCTARSTVYTACIAAGLMLSQFTKWLRNLPLERDQSLNLLSAEYSVS